MRTALHERAECTLARRVDAGSRSTAIIMADGRDEAAQVDGTRHTLFDEIAVVGKAFSSARRLEIIDLLSHGERTVESISSALGLKVGTTSAHLQILRLSNLVRSRRDGAYQS